MSPKSALVSALHSFIALAFLCLAGVCFAMEYSVSFRQRFLTHAFSFGVLLLSITALLTLFFYYLQKGKTLRVKMGVFIHEDLIQSTIEEFFSKHFPEKVHLSHVDILTSRIEITVSLPKKSTSDFEQSLARMEKSLAELLKKRFGYSNSFCLTIQNLNIID